MKKFSLPCDFNGQISPFVVYIGDPKLEAHPLQNQSQWLTKERGGTISPVIMESLKELHKISIENKLPFDELCEYAVKLGAQEKDGMKPDGS